MLEADGVGRAAAQHPVDERLRAHVGETDLVGIGNELSSDLFEQFRKRPGTLLRVQCSGHLLTNLDGGRRHRLRESVRRPDCLTVPELERIAPTTSPSPDVGGVGRPLKTRQELVREPVEMKIRRL